MKHVRAGLSVVIALLGATLAQAQDAPAQASPGDARMDVHGSFDVGVRSTDVTGSADMYERMFNLSDGVRLMNLDLFGAAPKTANLFADTFAVSVSGVADPFPAVQFTMRKSQRYDLRVNWRRSRFIDTYPSTPASIGGLDTQAVTDHHSWTTTRQIGNVGFVYDLTSQLHVLLNYSRVARSGQIASTRSLDFTGAPAVWGAFARANAYAVTSPADDSANRFAAGLSYSATRWTVNYQAGYQKFDQSVIAAAVGSPERSINVADPTTASELLTSLSSSQTRRLTSPLSELSYVVRPSSKLEWRGEYLFSRYRGPFNLAATYQGLARSNTAGTAFSPYTITVSGSGSAASPSHVIGQALTFRPADRWTLDADYRYSRFAMEATGQLGSVLAAFPTGSPAPVSATESDEESWRQASHALGLAVTFEPSPVWTFRPGVRVVHRDIERRGDGAIDPGTTQQSTTVWPEVTAAYRPTARFNARGSYRRASSDTSYTRLSPVDRTIGNLLTRYEPLEGLAIEASATVNDAELPAASFVSHTRFGSLQASYALGDRATVLGGIDYESFLGLGNVSFVRGVAPTADNAMADRERDRIWLVGAVVKVTSRLGVTGTANFLRTTGTDAIAGEPPLYGPMRFPYGTGSVSYDIPRAGRVSLDVSRSHWQQEILSLNDFRATLVTVRFSRDF